MSKVSRFSNLKGNAGAAKVGPNNSTSSTSIVQANREGRKVISGYFSPAMSAAMRMAAIRRGITLQAAMIEAFDLWLREQGESPIGD